MYVSALLWLWMWLWESVEDRGQLTGGGGLAGIDVADNDHVDVHLFLTAKKRTVSEKSIKIDAIVAMMLAMRWMDVRCVGS
jgi:hypothetical protein